MAQKGITYQERNIVGDEAAFADVERFGVATTPVILVGEEMMIGFGQAKLEALLSNYQVI